MAITASLQQPSVSDAAGYWPAFWMLGTQFRGNYLNWPGVGEVDIMEDINGRSSEFGTLHCGVAPGGPCHELTGRGSGQRPCPGCQSAFHTYMVIIDRSTSPEQIRWYLDGVNFFKVSANQIPADVWSATIDHPFFIIFNLAIGGAFPMAFGGGPEFHNNIWRQFEGGLCPCLYGQGAVTPTATIRYLARSSTMPIIKV